MSYVAFQYAEAVFALALEANKVEELIKEYDQFRQSIDHEIELFLTHPKIKKQDKKDVLSKTINDSLLAHFVFVLIDNNRIDLLHDIYEELLTIYNNQNKLMNAIVYSQKALPISDLNKLKNNLGMKHNRKVKLENIVDPTIIGGLRIEYEGQVLDETINNYLQKLKQNLTK
jgi:F-type H+-transporting ATPase subunit delta